MSLSVGQIVEGSVTGITNFGAFVELPDGRTGLVHISEIADTYVKDIREYFNMNDKVSVKIISIDEDGKKIGLSIRQAQPDYDPNKPRTRAPGSSAGSRARSGRGSRSDDSFEEKLARFLRESEKKQSDLRKSLSKRGGRSARF